MRRLAPCPASASASTARSARCDPAGSDRAPPGRLVRGGTRPSAGTGPHTPFGQPVRDAQVQPLPLALRERVVGDVAQHVGHEPPHPGRSSSRTSSSSFSASSSSSLRGSRSATARRDRTDHVGRPPPGAPARARPARAGRCGPRSRLHGRREQPPARSRTRRRQVPLLAPQHAHDLHDEERVPAGVLGHRSASPWWRLPASIASSVAWPSVSGSTHRLTASATPPAQFGRCSRNSHLATQSTMSGTFRASFTSCSMRSSRIGSDPAGPRRPARPDPRRRGRSTG